LDKNGITIQKEDLNCFIKRFSNKKDVSFTEFVKELNSL